MNRSVKEQHNAKKNAVREVFFEIDENRPFAHWGLHVLAGIVCVVFALWVWLLNPVPQIHGDQVNLATMVISKEHPENFVKDTIYSGSAANFYPPLPRAIVRSFINKFGIIGGHRAAQFPLSIAYLLVMYSVLYYLTRSVPASVLVACASIIWRWSLPESYWGLDRLQAIQPRSFVTVFIPILFVLLWKFRNSRWLLLIFFIAGLLFNLNPPSALFFSFLGLTSLFLISLRNRRQMLRLLGCGGMVIVGALPFILNYAAIRSRGIMDLSAQELQEYAGAIQYRYSNSTMCLPVPAATLAKVFFSGFAGPIFLASIAWCLRKEKRNEFDRWSLYFFLLAFVGMVAAQYVVQKIYSLFNSVPVLPCMRGQKFAYLVLYIYIGWFLAELLRRFGLREKVVLIAVTALIVAVMPLFGSNSQDPWGQWRYNLEQADKLLSGEKIESAGWHDRIASVCNWAKQNTPEDSLFLFAHRFMSPFRMYAQRSLVSSQVGRDAARSNGARCFTTWAKYQRELERITAERDVTRLLQLAKVSGADYIVVPGDFPKVDGWRPVFRDALWIVYKKQ